MIIAMEKIYQNSLEATGKVLIKLSKIARALFCKLRDNGYAYN